MMLLNMRKESLTASPSPTKARAASLTSWRALTTSSHSTECEDADEAASHEGEPSGDTSSATGAMEGSGSRTLVCKDCEGDGRWALHSNGLGG